MVNFIKLAAALSAASVAVAHPGHEAEERAHALASRDVRQLTARKFGDCQDQLKKRGHVERAQKRRAALAHKERAARKKRAVDAPYLKVRASVGNDTDVVLATDHEGSINGSIAMVDESIAFTGNSSCVLFNEGEVGPFWVLGEYLRSDLREDVDGIDIVTDVQFYDVNTCEPISGTESGAYWDVWNANATGVYSGVQGSGNAGGADLLNTTWLRGIVQLDEEGVGQVTTKYPGYYAGRTNHMHVILHLNATVLPNNTLTGGQIAHTGNFFWDQSLNDEVAQIYPYTLNTADVTTNAEDHVFALQETTDTTSDPVFNYVLLGDSVADGLFLWIDVGIDTSASYTDSYAAYLTADGGVSTSSSSSGGGGPGGAGGAGPF